jgi:hypothetical protein
MFDFDQDGNTEIVYRDEHYMRIIDGRAEDVIDPAILAGERNKAVFPNRSGTSAEYPVVADVDGDGQAEIIIVGGIDGADSPGITGDPEAAHKGRLWIYKSSDPASSPWAPTRKVWNQFAYHPLYVNEDLSIPRYPLNPATVFPGKDRVTGTADDTRPFNNYLQQQTTILGISGTPVWVTPDAVFDSDAEITAVSVGDSVSIRICIANTGDAPLGRPVYATLYKDNIHPDSIIKTDSIDGIIQPGDTDCLTIGVADINPFLPFVQLIVRLNDRGEWDGADDKYPYQQECHYCDSIRKRLNPARHLMMKKNATLNGVQHNGQYANPVSVLYGDIIHYRITGVFADTMPGDMIILDTLPPYMVISGSIPPTAAETVKGETGDTPSREWIHWTFRNLDPSNTSNIRTVEYEATPASGAVASQPLFINYARVNAVTGTGTLFSITNSTYHQGAGVSIVTFSASAGGQLFNAREQALDYRTPPRPGVLTVPDSGYVFAGWSHSEYISLRGDVIPADSGIMNCGDIVIYGNVELRADFIPEVKGNPEDKFIQEKVADNSDKVWSHDRDIYIRTRKGATVRIYSAEGILHRQLTATADGATAVRMERGIYIVTIDHGTGWKVRVE